MRAGVWAGVFTFFGAGHAGEGVGVDLAQLLAEVVYAVGEAAATLVVVGVAAAGVGGGEGLLHCFSQGGDVAGFLKAFDCGASFAGEHYVPGCEACDDESDYAGDHGQQDVVDRHEGVGKVRI